MTDARPGGAAMFDDIAPRYDLLNRLMSLGLDRRWRRRLVDSAPCPPGGRALDVATGSGDVAIEIARAYPEASSVVGLDPSGGMLEVAARKLGARGLGDRVALCAGDAEALPFADDTFDAVTIAFGIRNVGDRARGLSELARVARPGAAIAILEIAEPSGGAMGALARAHVRHVLPRLGAWLSRAPAYRYLQESMAAFPSPARFCDMMGEAGLTDPAATPFAFGAAHLYVGRAAPP